MKGYHYSGHKDLNVLELRYSGTGIKGEENKRRLAWSSHFIPRLYFYDNPDRKEPELGNYLYVVELRHLYVFPVKENCKIAKTAREMAGEIYPGDFGLYFNLLEKLISFGYNGIYIPKMGIIEYFRNVVV